MESFATGEHFLFFGTGSGTVSDDEDELEAEEGEGGQDSLEIFS